MTSSKIMLRHHDADNAGKLLDTLVSVQQEIYADAEPQEFFSEDRYRRQLDSHMTAPGWELAAAHTEAGDVAGYAYGFPLQPGSRWWQGLRTAVPDGMLEETGARTFALSELMVRKPWRRQGLGRRLHNELLGGRNEERATLLVEPGNTVGKAAYTRWGWTELGELVPGWDNAPVLEALILELPLR